MENQKKAPLHIVITNNATGETILEEDFLAIVGAISTETEMTKGICLLHGNLLTLAGAIKGAKLVIENNEKENPMLTFAEKILDSQVIEERTERRQMPRDGKGD